MRVVRCLCALLDVLAVLVGSIWDEPPSEPAPARSPEGLVGGAGAGAAAGAVGGSSGVALIHVDSLSMGGGGGALRGLANTPSACLHPCTCSPAPPPHGPLHDLLHGSLACVFWFAITSIVVNDSWA